MEAIAVHSSPPTTSSSLPSPTGSKRHSKKSRETKNAGNNKTTRDNKRQRSSVSPTAKGNGRRRIRLDSETESDSDSKPAARPVAAADKSKFEARDTVHRRLNRAVSDSNSDVDDPQKTPKPKRSVQSTHSTLRSPSPDPIDGLEEGSSPPPLAIVDINTSPRQSDEDTPKPKKQQRERSLAKLPKTRLSPTKIIRQPKRDIRRSPSDQPKATKQVALEPCRPASEFFGDSSRTQRKSTVSTSVLKKRSIDGASPQRSQEQNPARGPIGSASVERQQIQKTSAPSAGKKQQPATMAKVQGKDKKQTSKTITPGNRFSDDESEKVVGGGKKTLRKTKQSRRDEEGARFLDVTTTGKSDHPLSVEAKIKAKLQSEERLAAAQFDAEDHERAESWKGVERNNLQGESFFASTATVDIAETEERIARAQAAIDAKPLSLSQETDADELEEERYCARFCNYDDLCDICFGPMPKRPSNDLVKLRKKLKRGAHRTQGITFCTMHRAETRTLPLGWRAGYPKELDFASIDSRLEEGFIRDRIARVANSPKSSKFFRRAQRNIDRVGLTRWQSLTAQSSDEVLSTATPGYYGDLGRAIIIQHFQLLVKWKLLRLRSDDIQPLSSSDFIIHVLVPEAAILLIMQDQGWDGGTGKEAARAKAMDTHRQSGEYGRAAFREESAQGRDVLGHLEATLEQKRKRLERRAREEAEVHRSQAIEVLSSDLVDPSSDYGDDPAWLNDAFEAYEALEPTDVTPRPRLPSTKLPRTALHSSQYS